MQLKEWDWNAQQYIEVEYPDEPIKEFVDWLRNTRQWYQGPDPGRDVYTRYQRLQDELIAARNRATTARAAYPHMFGPGMWWLSAEHEWAQREGSAPPFRGRKAEAQAWVAQGHTMPPTMAVPSAG